MNRINLSKIQNVLTDAVAEKKMSGMSCLIWKDGREEGYYQAGFSDIEAGKKFSRDTICRLYSMTKPVTAAAAMILLEEGKFDLIDPVSDFIPEFKNPTVCKNGKIEKCYRPVLIQDLLNMTSGYSYGGDSDESEKQISKFIHDAGGLEDSAAGANNISTLDVAKKLGKMPLSFEPGTNYQYGLSADILGAVIEVISGMKLGEFMEKNIFQPLGMFDTKFFVPEEKQNRLAKVYESSENGELKVYTGCNLGIQNDMKKSPAFESGGAGLVSTIDDYMKFTQMLCNGGIYDGKRILNEPTIKFMSEARLRPSLQQYFDWKMEHLSGYSYANLCRVCIEPGQCRAITEKGEFGWDGWLGPYMSVDLKNNLAIVCMMQQTGAGTTSTTRRVKNIIYTSL